MKKLNSLILLFTLATIDAPPVAVDGYLIERAKGSRASPKHRQYRMFRMLAVMVGVSPWSRGEPARTGRRSPQ